jgi:peptidoglycan/LPS O-acetylase OafA/YrhL
MAPSRRLSWNIVRFNRLPAHERAVIYQTEHVKALDGLRGYAALAVTFYHAILQLQPALIDRVLMPSVGALQSEDLPAKAVLAIFDGEAAVLLFYVLSGCVLCRSLVKAPSSPRSLSLFTLRRALRLLPPMAVCMAVMWGLSQSYAIAGIGTFPVVTAWNAAKNALLIQISVHGPSTSIQIEALATPFIILFSLLYRAFSIPAAIAVFALSIFAIEMPALLFDLPNMHMYLFVFMLGMLVALPEFEGVFAKATGSRTVMLLVAALLVRHIGNRAALTGMIAQVMLLGAAVGSVRWSLQTGWLHRFLGSAVSQFLGRTSYSYYLLNVVVLWVLWFSPAFSSLQNWSNPLVGGLVVGTIAAIATMPLAHLSQRYCEAPFINLGRKLSIAYSRGGRDAA